MCGATEADKTVAASVEFAGACAIVIPDAPNALAPEPAAPLVADVASLPASHGGVTDRADFLRLNL